jgi:hypothetical protein
MELQKLFLMNLFTGYNPKKVGLQFIPAVFIRKAWQDF